MKHEQPVSPERFDILDAAGHLTGLHAPKEEVHQQGLWHRDVHVWVTDGVHLLQQQRAWDKAIMPGAWDIAVGGHVSAGESYLDAAIRETHEEIGLHIAPEHFVPAGVLAVEMAIASWEQPHRTVGDNFVIVDRGLSLEQLTAEAGKVIGLRLYPIDQLEADLQHPRTAELHAPQPLELWQLGIDGMRRAIATR